MKKRLSMLAAGISSALAVTPLLATEYEVTVTNLSAGMYFTPLIAAAHDPAARMFVAGAQASAQLQAIAEGGDVSAMADLLNGIGASVATGDGLLGPGQSATLIVDGDSHNSVLSVSAMILPTNDGFVGIDSVHFPSASEHSRTVFARGYDAGTEANDELIGGGAPGVAGFPAPPPVVASGTGTGASGVSAPVEGHISVHKGVLGDLDPNGGASDINAAVHGWLNPIARVTITALGGSVDADGPGALADLSGLVYSSSALEIFWEPALAGAATVTGYRVYRNGNVIDTLDALSYFDSGLNANTEYTYTVRAIDANGAEGPESSVRLTTNSQ